MIVLRWTGLKANGSWWSKKKLILLLDGSQMCFCWGKDVVVISQVFPAIWVGIIHLTCSHSTLQLLISRLIAKKYIRLRC